MRYEINHIKTFTKKDKLKLLDKVLLVIAVVAPLTTIPQIIKIFQLQTSTGVSLISWLIYAILDIPWIFYGIIYKNKPVLIAYILWFIMNLSVVVGVLIYP